MKDKITLFTLLIVILAVSCHRDPVKPPGDDGLIDAKVTIVVADPDDHAISKANVWWGSAKANGWAVDYTSFAGTTYPLYFADVDTTYRLKAHVKKPGYVPVYDTFNIMVAQPQYHQVILPWDTRCIQGGLIFIIQDTAGSPIQDASASLYWYPGAGWDSLTSELLITAPTGRTPEYLVIIDSTRNSIEATVGAVGFREIVDTIAIIADSTQEVLYKLIPE